MEAWLRSQPLQVTQNATLSEISVVIGGEDHGLYGHQNKLLLNLENKHRHSN